MTVQLMRRFLLGSLLVVSLAAFAAGEPATRYIDSLAITDFKDFTTTSLGRRSKQFQADPALGPVWVIVDFIGAPVDSSRDGRATFDIMPEAIPVPAGTNFAIFESQHMARFDPDTALMITAGGVTKKLVLEDFRAFLSKEDFEQLRRATTGGRGFLQLIKVNRFAIPADRDTDIGVSVNTMDNMLPSVLRLTIGQGAIPLDVQRVIDQTNGSWLYRYRHFVLAMAGCLALLIALFRWRRS
ncbi:MAG: hypothetical protein R3F58_00510 [Steroidobacteraceae bacterium]|nr:hypothetical protein [Steroidobacteraceae bacterium]